jgi:thiol-disulfide isomerase/thioredoxin
MSTFKRTAFRGTRPSLVSPALSLLLLAAACGDPRNEPKPEPRTPGLKSATATATATVKASASASTSAAPATKVGEQALAKLDVAKLNDRERADLVAQLDALTAPCKETPVPLSQCIVEKRDCAACRPAGDLLASLVRRGETITNRAEFYKMRFDPEAVKSIEIGESPSKGPADAAVTIVEWADFQCPGCQQMGPFLEAMVERFPGQVRVVYKFYHLSTHPQSLDSAHAAQAAHKQGKFWEMNQKLFENLENQSKSDLRKYAREIGLDLDKFKADLESEETKKIVAADMKAADELGLDSTPLIFINGRKFKDAGKFVQDFEAWLKLDIEMSGQKPAEATEKYKALAKLLQLEEEGGGDGKTPPPGGSSDPAPSSSASAGPPVGSASAGPATSASAGAPKKTP